MALDATDLRLGDLDKTNAPMQRARRVVESKITELENELHTWKFVRDVLDHELNN